MTIAIIIPTYNSPFLIDPLMDQICDLEDYAEIVVVDNGGDYRPRYHEHVFVPGENLGWLRGCNAGLKVCDEAEKLGGFFSGYLLLNDDVSLSPNFLSGLELTMKKGYGIVAPIYDDVYDHQKTWYQGPANEYHSGQGSEWDAKFVDGTAMLISRGCYKSIGLLDAEHFGKYGWGADYDYCIRAREAGYPIAVTDRSYLNHFHQGTARTISDNWNGIAGNEMQEGMSKKYGEEWRKVVGV